MYCRACGYRKEFDIEEQEKIKPKGEDFIQIRGSYTAREGTNYYNERVYDINLYGCPKCKSVIFKEVF